MERYFSTGQSPQRAGAPTEEEEDPTHETQMLTTAKLHSPQTVLSTHNAILVTYLAVTSKSRIYIFFSWLDSPRGPRPPRC